MKLKTSYLFIFLLWVCAFAACSDEETIQPSITIQEDVEALTLEAKKDSRIDLHFTSTYPWTASTDTPWLLVSPASGEAGEASLSLLTREDNQTGDIRNGTVVITSEGIVREIAVRQEAVDVLNVDKLKYDVSADAQELEIAFTTNLNGYKIQIANVTAADMSWVQLKETQTKALQEDKIIVNVAQNLRMRNRTATFVLQSVDLVTGKVLVQSAAVTLTQASVPIGTSSDYSSDKKAIELQRHTEGNGIPLIFMGDGFLDKDINSGYYLQVMQKAIECFFTEEPVKSLRPYFDVWTVTAVSVNNAFGNQYTTRFSCWLEGGGSTGVGGNHDTVAEYASVVPLFRDNPDLFDEATCIVILNTEEYAGTCYFRFVNEQQQIINLAIGYCPMINGMKDDYFRKVITHECIGHGFTKLLDEYSYEEMGRIPESEIAENRAMQAMGWAANVDFTDNRNKVLWSRFLQDSRYQNADNYGETLGVYEGACTYWSGAYRPTGESMMRSNIHGFNAPSREAIYKRVMKLAYGESWSYDYETFVAFDQAHLPVPSEAETRGTEERKSLKPFAHPVYTDRLISLYK